MKRRHILVVGGFGFIGSHLVELLLADERARITVVDDLSSSPLPVEHLLQELGNPADLEYSVKDAASFARGWRHEDFDEVYQLASPVGPAGILPHAGSIASQVIDTAAAFSDLCLRSHARLLYVSSSEVYDGGDNGVCSEEMPRIVGARPSVRREYAAAKIAAELLFGNLARTRGLDVRIVRPFNVAGPRQSARGGFVVPRLVSQALAGEPLTVFGDGHQVRALTHVREIAAGLIAVMERTGPGEVFNLGNRHNRTTILELAELVRSYTGTPGEVRFVDPKEVFGELYEEANDKLPDVRKAERRLDWRPRMDCRRIVEETVDYFESLSGELRERLAG